MENRRFEPNNRYTLSPEVRDAKVEDDDLACDFERAGPPSRRHYQSPAISWNPHAFWKPQKSGDSIRSVDSGYGSGPAPSDSDGSVPNPKSPIEEASPPRKWLKPYVSVPARPSHLSNSTQTNLAHTSSRTVSREIFSLLEESPLEQPNLGSENSRINSKERAFLQAWQEEWYARSETSSRHVEPMSVLTLLPIEQVKAHLSEVLFKFHRRQHVLEVLKNAKSIAAPAIVNSPSAASEEDEMNYTDSSSPVVQPPTTKSIPFRMAKAPNELLWEVDILVQQSEVEKSLFSRSPIPQCGPMAGGLETSTTLRKRSRPLHHSAKSARMNTRFSSFSINSSSLSSLGMLDQFDIPKKQLLDTLMTNFYGMFDSYMGFIHRAESGSSIGSRQSSTASATSLNKDSSKGGNRRRKGNQAEDLSGEEDDGGSRKRHKKPTKLEDPDSASKKRLACPYFKHDPRRYIGLRSCPGPGWDTIHRLKEHLYRRHALPPQCPRCCQAFRSEARLKEHLLAEKRCTVRRQGPLEGFDKSQEEKLKCRKSSFRSESEEDKWRDVYLILFPDTPAFAVPSPYYEDEGTEQQNGPSLGVPALEQYEAFLARELPRKVRKELEKAMESLLGPIEETLKNQLENIVRNCQENLSKTYQESISPSQAKTTEDTNSSLALNSIPTMPQSERRAAVLNDLAPYAVPPEALMDFPAEAGPSCTAPTVASDSAYYSESRNPDTDIPDDALWPIQFEEMTTVLTHDTHQYTGMMGDLDDIDVLSTFTNEVPSRYSGKGKGRADPFVDETL